MDGVVKTRGLDAIDFFKVGCQGGSETVRGILKADGLVWGCFSYFEGVLENIGIGFGGEIFSAGYDVVLGEEVFEVKMIIVPVHVDFWGGGGYEGFDAAFVEALDEGYGVFFKLKMALKAKLEVDFFFFVGNFYQAIIGKVSKHEAHANWVCTAHKVVVFFVFKRTISVFYGDFIPGVFVFLVVKK